MNFLILFSCAKPTSETVSNSYGGLTLLPLYTDYIDIYRPLYIDLSGSTRIKANVDKIILKFNKKKYAEYKKKIRTILSSLYV